MKKWSEKFFLNYQIINQGTFQKYFFKKCYSFTKATQKLALINPSKIQSRN